MWEPRRIPPLWAVVVGYANIALSFMASFRFSDRPVMAGVLSLWVTTLLAVTVTYHVSYHLGRHEKKVEKKLYSWE